MCKHTHHTPTLAHIDDSTEPLVICQCDMCGMTLPHIDPTQTVLDCTVPLDAEAHEWWMENLIKRNLT